MSFLEGYSAKVLEYVLAVAYLALFVGFWRYVRTPISKKEVRS